MDEKVIRLATILLLSASIGFIIAVGTYPKIFTQTEYVYLNVTKEVKVVEYVPVERVEIREVNVTVNKTITTRIVPNFLQAAEDIYSNRSYYLSYYPSTYRDRMNDDYVSLVRSRLGYEARRKSGWLGNEFTNCITWSEVCVPVNGATATVIEAADYANYHDGVCGTSS